MALSAEYLKTRYTVYGSFYDLQLPGQIIPCRNLLEIYDQAYHSQAGFTNILPPAGLFNGQAPGPLHQGTPDAIAIMMNPGSSEPRQAGFTPPAFPFTTAIQQIKNHQLVYAKPDTTQYQIMRLMEEKNWKHVRILNLSDIREPKSGPFMQKAAELTRHIGCALHSIFCDDRAGELAAALPINIPVILAWGQDEKLLPLAGLCLPKIKGRKIYGIPSETEPRLYAHASPTLQAGKDTWLAGVLTQ